VTQLTTEAKLKTLATWSRQYKAGVREVVESGEVDADELDDLLNLAEQDLEQERIDQQKKAMKRAATRKF